MKLVLPAARGLLSTSMYLTGKIDYFKITYMILSKKFELAFKSKANSYLSST